MTANAMNNNTFPNTRAGSIRRWAAGAIVGSLFVVGFVLGLAFPSMVGVTTDDSSLRGTSNARAQPAAAATIAAPANLRATTSEMPTEGSHQRRAEGAHVKRHLMDGTIWDINWPSEADEESERGFYAAWGPEEDDVSNKDEEDILAVKKSLFGLTETQRSVSWGLAGLEHDLIGLDTSYSYEFETLAEKLTGFTEDYSYTFSYEV